MVLKLKIKLFEGIIFFVILFSFVPRASAISYSCGVQVGDVFEKYTLFSGLSYNSEGTKWKRVITNISQITEGNNSYYKITFDYWIAIPKNESFLENPDFENVNYDISVNPNLTAGDFMPLLFLLVPVSQYLAEMPHDSIKYGVPRPSVEILGNVVKINYSHEYRELTYDTYSGHLITTKIFSNEGVLQYQDGLKIDSTIPGFDIYFIFGITLASVIIIIIKIKIKIKTHKKDLFL